MRLYSINTALIDWVYQGILIALGFAIFAQYIFVFCVGEFALFLDEAFLILVSPLFLRRCTRDKSTQVSILILATIASVLYILEQHPEAFLADFLFFAKPYVYFWGSIEMLSRLKPKAIRTHLNCWHIFFFAAVSYGAAQSIALNAYHKDFPLLIPKPLQLHFVLYRVNSFFMHPVWFGLLCSIFLVFAYRTKRYIALAFASLGLLLSFTRLAIGLGTILCFLHFLLKPNRLKTLYLYILAICVSACWVTISDFAYKTYSTSYETYTSENTIKLYGVKKAAALVATNPFGYGLGSFGTASSVGSDTNRSIGFNSHMLSILNQTKSGIESTWTILAVQLGIIGLLAYTLPFTRIIAVHRDPPSFLYFGFLIIYPTISELYIPPLLYTIALFWTHSQHEHPTPFTSGEEQPSPTTTRDRFQYSP